MNRPGFPIIDKFVGVRLRERRILLGLSQRDLAESLALTTQQMVAKYELGKNAVSAALLYEIAGVLGTSVDYFFDGFEKNEAPRRPLYQPRLLDLMRSFNEIESRAHREAINHLIRVLATDTHLCRSASRSSGRRARRLGRALPPL
jgi:transcriptional regulator with XRE-family HTH domain